MGRRSLVVGVLAAALGAPGAAHAQAPMLPSNDLQGALALTGSQTPVPVAVQSNHEPPLDASPAADCGPGSHPLAGEQGRVTQADVDSPQAARGWTCNLSVVANVSTAGGFRVWRYVDPAGHVCAFYDTSIASAIDVVSLGAGPSQGAAVLDVSDPAHPVQTDLLTAPGTLAPHESLNLNSARGLLAAETGTAGTAPAILSVYDVSRDCRHPVLDSDTVIGATGHESGFSPDGRTFWDGGAEGIIAVDLSDPTAPKPILTLNEYAHGLNLSDDGDTLYDTDPVDGGLTVLDVSEIQARKPDPHVYELSRLIWKSVSIPQNTNPMTIDGHKYLLEYDEFAFRFNPATMDDEAGAARIIDIDDPRHPQVVSNLRLAVNQQAAHRAADGDPSFLGSSALQYGAHYCSIPREVAPEIAACSFLNSGLRIFDIRDPLHPREVAYFVSPPGTAQGQKADAAFAQPAFDPARREVYFTDATTGFWNVKLDDAVWPDPTSIPGPVACTSKRKLVVHVRKPRRGRITRVTALLGGKALAVRRVGRRYQATVRLVGLPRSTVHVLIRVRTSRHVTLTQTRTFRTCRRRS